MMRVWTLSFRLLKFTAELGGWLLIQQAYYRFPEHPRATIKNCLHQLATEGYFERVRRGVYRLTEKGWGVVSHDVSSS